MDFEPFASVRLRGKRFDRKGLPVAAAEFLARFERVVAYMARLAYLEQHPQRRRAPRGWRSALDLRVVGFEDGSTVPLLERETTPFGVATTGIPDYYDVGLRMTVETVAAVSQGRKPPHPLTDVELAEFQALAALLQADEKFEVGQSAGSYDAIMNAGDDALFEHLRDDLKKIDRGVAVGQIIGTNSAKQTFLMQTASRQITGSYDIAMAAAVREHQVDEQSPDRPTVAITGDVLRKANGAISEFRSVDYLTLAGEQAREIILDRLKTLFGLRPGWAGPGSAALSPQAWVNYEHLLTSLGHRVDTRAEPIGTPGGGIRLEWERYGDQFIAEIEPEGGLYLCVLRKEGPRADAEAEVPEFASSTLEAFIQDGAMPS